MKVCPVCGSRCFDDMDVCYGCLHDFMREGPSPISQAVESACESEVEEAVLPVSIGDNVFGIEAETASLASVEDRLRKENAGATPARIARARDARKSTHIVVPLDGCTSSPVLTQEFRLVISLEPAM